MYAVKTLQDKGLEEKQNQDAKFEFMENVVKEKLSQGESPARLHPINWSLQTHWEITQYYVAHANLLCEINILFIIILIYFKHFFIYK